MCLRFLGSSEAAPAPTAGHTQVPARAAGGEAGTAHGPRYQHIDPPLPSSAGDRTQVGPKALEPRQRPPPKVQQEQARALPLGALYTAAVVAFVLYKCLQQRKDEAAVLQEEADKKESLQSEQQLAQLTQQLAQTEQHLNNLMAQLDPLFER